MNKISLWAWSGDPSTPNRSKRDRRNRRFFLSFLRNSMSSGDLEARV